MSDSEDDFVSADEGEDTEDEENSPQNNQQINKSEAVIQQYSDNTTCDKQTPTSEITKVVDVKEVKAETCVLNEKSNEVNVSGKVESVENVDEQDSILLTETPGIVSNDGNKITVIKDSTKKSEIESSNQEIKHDENLNDDKAITDAFSENTVVCENENKDVNLQATNSVEKLDEPVNDDVSKNENKVDEQPNLTDKQTENEPSDVKEELTLNQDSDKVLEGMLFAGTANDSNDVSLKSQCEKESSENQVAKETSESNPPKEMPAESHSVNETSKGDLAKESSEGQDVDKTSDVQSVGETPQPAEGTTGDQPCGESEDTNSDKDEDVTAKAEPAEENTGEEATADDWSWGDSNSTLKVETKAPVSKSKNPNSECDDFFENFEESTTKKQESSKEPVKENQDSRKEEPAKDDWGWEGWTEGFLTEATSKLSNLVEKVEGTLGIPDPVELAKKAKSEEVEAKTGENNTVEMKVEPVTKPDNDAASSSWFSSFSPLTNIVQAASQELMTEGIGKLELLGKKTVDLLMDGDPGLRNTRKNLTPAKTSLSAALQEAKLKSEQRERAQENKGVDAANLNDMLEKHQGIAHLEALQMLSNECESKLERILSVQSEEARQESLQLLVSVKNKFQLTEITEDCDFKKQVFLLNKKVNLKVTCSKLLNAWTKLQAKECNPTDTVTFYEHCIGVFAEILSRELEYFRRIADMLGTTDVNAKMLVGDRSLALKRLTELFIWETTKTADRFAEQLASTAVISDVYLESSNCIALLQDAHNLLMPLLQCSAIK